MKFECHLTFSIGFAASVQSYAHDGWKFSKIDGDPVLGDKVFCYLTAYDDNIVDMLNRMNAKAAFLQQVGVPVIRKKIELILVDERKE